MSIEQQIESKAAELAGLEVAFNRSYASYLEAADQFRRCSQERDRLHAELLTLKQQRRRAQADDEVMAYCEFGI